MSEPTGHLSAAELIAELRAFGMTQREIAENIGRSERMVRKIIRGETSGALYRECLQGVYDTGRQQRPVPRLTGKDGKPRRVRAKAGSKDKMRVPDDPATDPKRSTWTKPRATYLQGGQRKYTWELPTTGDEAGKAALAQAHRDMTDENRRRAQGRNRGKFRVNFTDGSSVLLGAKGGYKVSHMHKKLREQFGGDWNAWAKDQMANRADGVSVSDPPDLSLPIESIEPLYYMPGNEESL